MASSLDTRRIASFAGRQSSPVPVGWQSDGSGQHPHVRRHRTASPIKDPAHWPSLSCTATAPRATLGTQAVAVAHQVAVMENMHTGAECTARLDGVVFRYTQLPHGR